ncbi:hypothetical protein EJB05_57271, partial [Eragrostis curvula]
MRSNKRGKTRWDRRHDGREDEASATRRCSVTQDPRPQGRGLEGGKLVVDCAGEGLLFVEADADVRLADLEVAGLRAPFPGMDELLFDVEGTSSMLNCLLLLIQLSGQVKSPAGDFTWPTWLLCDGFVLALRLNHTICDAIGIIQFMSAVGQLARGFPTVAVQPAWVMRTSSTITRWQRRNK